MIRFHAHGADIEEGNVKVPKYVFRTERDGDRTALQIVLDRICNLNYLAVKRDEQSGFAGDDFQFEVILALRGGLGTEAAVFELDIPKRYFP